jgi:hypothetical protein
VKKLIAPRRGAALVVAIVVLVLIGFLSTALLQSSVQEVRIASYSELALRLRLHAEATAATVAGHWTPAMDSLEVRRHLQVRIDSSTEAAVEYLGGGLHLVRATAAGPAGIPAKASAALLTFAPALRPGLDPGAAALSAASATVLNGGSIDGHDAACAGDRSAVLLPGGGTFEAAAGGTVKGDIVPGRIAEQLLGALPRLLTAAAAIPAGGPLRFHTGDLSLAQHFVGVMLVTGSLVILEGAQVTGLVVAGGDLDVRAGASISGAAHVAGSARVAGSIRRDACSARAAAADAALTRSRRARLRSGVPAF